MACLVKQTTEFIFNSAGDALLNFPELHLGSIYIMIEEQYEQYEYEVIEALHLLTPTTPIVYAITNGELVKIGKSTVNNIFNRLSNYITHNIGSELLWIAVNEIEHDVHNVYEKYRVNKRREWFNDVDGLIKEHIYRRHRIKHSIFGDYVYYSVDELKKSIESAKSNMKNDCFRKWIDELHDIKYQQSIDPDY